MTRNIRWILLVVVLLAVPAASFGALVFSVSIAPPVLPVYSQPLCPGPSYIWAPGYWAYGDDGYYWVPGTWELAPFAGALWTPGYWGWSGGLYRWHDGYWGPHVGFYGGINYGFGYAGVGYSGGYWRSGSFYYNTAVNHVDRNVVRNVYSRSVVSNARMNRVSYNGGSSGIRLRPTAAETAAARERRSGPTAAQTQFRRSASTNRAQFASVNRGRPATLATAGPTTFPGHPAASKNVIRPPAASASRSGHGSNGASHIANSQRSSRPTPHGTTASRARRTNTTVPHAQYQHSVASPTSQHSARNNLGQRQPTQAHSSAPARHSGPPHSGSTSSQSARHPSGGSIARKQPNGHS